MDPVGNFELAGGDIERLSAATVLTGLRVPHPDVLAHYLPYHFYCGGVWGIYIHALGVIRLATVVKGTLLAAGDSSFADVAEHVLFNHEAYDCRVEAAATQAEVVARQPVYHSYFDDRRAVPHEEALANAYAYRQLTRFSPQHAPSVGQWMSSQGVGYGDFHRYAQAADFRRGQQECGRHIIRHVPGGRIPASATPAGFLFDSLRMGRIPTFLVVDDIVEPYVLRPFPKFNGMVIKVHSRDHPPPHIHIEMPPGELLTKYVWDEPLRPVPECPQLSSKAGKRFEEYVARFGQAIHEEVCKKYPGHTIRRPALLDKARCAGAN